MALSDRQRLTLRRLKAGPATPANLNVSFRTFVALERRGLIKVETTFGSIMFPRNALAHITDAGRQALAKRVNAHQ